MGKKIPSRKSSGAEEPAAEVPTTRATRARKNSGHEETKSVEQVEELYESDMAKLKKENAKLMSK